MISLLTSLTGRRGLLKCLHQARLPTMILVHRKAWLMRTSLPACYASSMRASTSCESMLHYPKPSEKAFPKWSWFCCAAALLHMKDAIYFMPGLKSYWLLSHTDRGCTRDRTMSQSNFMEDIGQLIWLNICSGDLVSMEPRHVIMNEPVEYGIEGPQMRHVANERNERCAHQRRS